MSSRDLDAELAELSEQLEEAAAEVAEHQHQHQQHQQQHNQSTQSQHHLPNPQQQQQQQDGQPRPSSASATSASNYGDNNGDENGDELGDGGDGGIDEDAEEEFDEEDMNEPQSARPQTADERKPDDSHRRNSNAGTHTPKSSSASSASAKSKSSSLQRLGVAMPLLLHSAAGLTILKQSTISEMLKECVAAGRDDSSSASSSKMDEQSTKDKSGKNEQDTTTQVHEHDEHLRSAPYHIEADNRSSCAECLKHALIPAFSHAQHLQPTPMYALEYSLKQQALQLFAQARWTKAPHRPAGSVASSASELSVLSQLLLNYLGEPPSTTASSSSSNVVDSAPLDPRFLRLLTEAMANQSPLSIDLSSSEEQFYTRISTLCLAASSSNANTGSSVSVAASSQLRETLVKFMLGRGSVQQTFDAISYLIRDCASTPLHLTAFLSAWRQLMRSRKSTILRVSRLKHLSEIGTSARKVQLVCSSSQPNSQTPNPAKRPGRTWNFESDSGWVRLDERICQILEDAYQSGKTSVDYAIESQGFTYRADLVKMTQKNLQTSRERPLRCLLALMIKEKGGRISSTVEINMPHTTTIRELRSELANYLRWDEKLLRMTYGSKVLRKADFESVSIRDGIVPLGSDPLTVTKLLKGDIEELCTFTVTGPKATKQPLYECMTCMSGFVMCSVCAMQCHRGHETRLVTDANGESIGFCCCGAGAGADMVPCKALEQIPEDAETFYGPHMTSSCRGEYLYILSTEYGLLKIGTGTRDTVTGKLYAQNSRLASHAGAQLACAIISDREVLLMRTPILGPDSLLHIDTDTLLFLPRRTVLSSSNASILSIDSPPSSFVSGAQSWQLEYSLKPDVDSPDANVLSEDGEAIPPGGWTQIPASLLRQLKSTLCTNWYYGHTCWMRLNDSSLMSVVLEEEGMTLRLPSKLGIKRYRMRLKHYEHIMPIFSTKDQLLVMQLTEPPQKDTSSRTTRSREYGLVIDTHQLPSPSSVQQISYCRSCSRHVPESPSVHVCIELSADEKPLHEPVVLQRETSIEDAPSLPPSLPASPAVMSPIQANNALSSIAPTSTDDITISSNDSSEMAFEPLPSFLTPSPSTSPLTIESISSLASLPIGDSFYEHAWTNAMALPTASIAPDSCMQVGIAFAPRISRTTLEAVVDRYKLIVEVNSANMKSVVCDGCGSSGAAIRLADGTIEPSSGALSRLSVCIDRACADSNVCLCKWCALMGNWHSSTHRASHAMQRVNSDIENEANLAGSNATLSTVFPSSYEHLHLGEFAAYMDFARGSLVILRSPSPVAAAAAHRESCLLFDYNTGVCTAKRICIKTRGDCYVKDEITHDVWAFATVGARLERWEGLAEIESPAENKKLIQSESTIHPLDAAMMLLTELPAIASSSTIMSSSLQQTYELLERVFSDVSTPIHQTHPQLPLALLSQLRIQLVNWSVQTNPLRTASPQSLADTSVEQDSALASVANKIAALLEIGLGIKHAVDRLKLRTRNARQIRSPAAARTVFIDDTSSSQRYQNWSMAVQESAVKCLVEGFELFYTNTSQRIVFLAALMESGNDLPKVPCSAQLLDQLSSRYRLVYMGLKHVKSFVDGSVTSSKIISDVSMFTSDVQNFIHTWVELMSDEDTGQAESMIAYDTKQQHPASMHVLHYELQLIQLVTFLNQPAFTNSPPTSSISRQVRLVNRAYIKLATLVFQQASEIVQSATRHHEEQQAADEQDEVMGHGHFELEKDPNLAVAKDAAMAESILQFLGESSIGVLLSWILLSLTELQVDKLAIATTTAHANLIPQFLKSCISLICILSELQTRALKVSRVEQSHSLLIDALTANRTRARLGDTRRKIVALRQSGQLLTLRSLRVKAGTAAAAVRGSSSRKSKTGASQPLYVLTPAAAEVFTEIFYEFATQYEPIPHYGVDGHIAGWNLGRAAMSRADLAAFIRKRGAHTHESALQRAIAQCTKYGRSSTSADGTWTTNSSHVFGDESSLMSLQGFLRMITDLSVENSRRLMRDLRVLELRHHFLNTHHPSLHILPDMRISFAKVVERLFSQAPNAGGVNLPGINRALDTPLPASAPALSYAQALHTRSVEEIVNILPGSLQMSTSLATAVAASKLAASNASENENENNSNANASSSSFPQDVILKLLSSQESFNRQGALAKSTLSFLSLFIVAPIVEISTSLPVKSPTVGLTPTLIHEVYAEDVASSLVGESSTKKHASMLTNSTSQSHAFTDALCTQRLSELFQRCMKEAAAQGVGTLILPILDEPTPNSKSLLATMSMVAEQQSFAPPSHMSTISASSALFLCEKLFACALIKHNGLTDACIAYSRSLELYRLLSNNLTKNVRLLTAPSCPEWFRKVVRATARYVRTPIIDIIKVHRERKLEEETTKRAKNVPSSGAISETSSTRERKEDEERTTLTVDTKLNVSASDDEALGSASSSPNDAPNDESVLCASLYRTLDRMTSNAEFLLGTDVRLIMMGMGAHSSTQPHTRTISKSNSTGFKAPPIKVSPPSENQSLAIPRGDDLSAMMDTTPLPGDEDDDNDEEDVSWLANRFAASPNNGLLLRRVHSDLFASPARGVSGSIPQQDVGVAIGPSIRVFPPSSTTPTNARRLSDSMINLQHVLGTNLERPGTGGAKDTAGLSSWTSTSITARASPQTVDDTDTLPIDQSTPFGVFESDWLAQLMSSEKHLASTIGAGIQWLTCTMQNRIKLLQLLNGACQSGHTQEIVDDILNLEVCRSVIRDIQTSNSMRSTNQDTTQNALLFFYQHLAQTLSKLDWSEAESEYVMSEQVPDSLPLMHTRSSPMIHRQPSVYPIGSDAIPSSTSSSHTSAQRYRMRQVSSRIRTILSIFSMTVSPNDSDMLLASGLLSVLPRFIFRLLQAQLQYQQRLHAQLYQAAPQPSPDASPRALSRALSRSGSFGVSISHSSSHVPATAPPAAPSASSFWLTDEEVKLSSFAQGLSHQIFMYQASSLLGLAPSRKTQQQRYVLASTLGRQLNAMIQHHIGLIQLAISTGFPFPVVPSATSEVPPSNIARVRSEDMHEFGLYPLQLGNPLQIGLRELDELIFRTVDMLNLLQRISSQEHSVCSRKHILFMLRVLRNDGNGGSHQVMLPTVIQMEIIKLLRRELTYHAPVASHPNPPSSASSTVNSPMAATKPGTPQRTNPFGRHLGSSVVISPSPSPPPPSLAPTSSPLMRTPSLIAEDVAYAEVNLAVELLDTVASMQSQQQLFNMQQRQIEEKQKAARAAAAHEKLDSSSSGDEKSASPVAMTRSLSNALLKTLPRGKDSLPPINLSPRQQSFRRVAVLLCPSCEYIEFPACPTHQVFLTRQLHDGSAACPNEQCTSNTGTRAQWSRCMACKKVRSDLGFWLISESEATYCASAIKNNQTPIIQHNVFLCSTCHVAEFPGTKTGGLTLNVDGKLYDKPTKKFLSTDLYRFTHFDTSCQGEVKLTPVRLSKEEATYLGRFIKRTPVIDPSMPLADFGPGKGSVLNSLSDGHPSAEGDFTGHSAISVLGQLLGEPYAMQSWLPTPQGQQTALMEMVNLMRHILSPNSSHPQKERHASSLGGEPQLSVFMSRAVSSVDVTSPNTPVTATQLPTSLRTQWRDAVLPILKTAYFDTQKAISDLSAPSIPFIYRVNSKRALYSVLALQILGGLSESLHTGSKVQVRINGTLITGVVQHYDPMLATVSVAMKRSLANETSNEKSASDSSNQHHPRAADADVSALLHSLGLSREVTSGLQGVFEFPIDQVTPISPSVPPSLAAIGNVSEFVRQACQVLTMHVPTNTTANTKRQMAADEERKMSDSDTNAIDMKENIHSLLLAQTQHHLLLCLMHYLPSWVQLSSTASDVSQDVLHLLSIALNCWQDSTISNDLPLHSQEWSHIAQVSAQHLYEYATRVQQDPTYTRRKQLEAQLTSPESQSAVNSSGATSGTTSTAGGGLGIDTSAGLKRTISLNASPNLSSSSSSSSLLPASSSAPSMSRASSNPLSASSLMNSLSLIRTGLQAVSSELDDSDEEVASPAISISIASAPPIIPSMLQNLQRLETMGFPSVACRFALASTRGNLEASISVILERLNDEESEIDEQMANEAFEGTIDRMGQREAVDAYRDWQLAAARRQAEAMMANNNPPNTPMGLSSPSMGPSMRPGTASTMRKTSTAELSDSPLMTEAERKLLASVSHLQMANRYSYSQEDPLEALVLGQPLDSATASSRALNTSSRPVEYSVEQDRANLLARALNGTLIGAELYIPPDAFDATIGTRVGASTKRFPYKIGDTLTIIDLVNKVCPAVVDDINEETGKIFLHYIGWCCDPRTRVVLHGGEVIPMSKLESHHMLLGDDGRTPVAILPGTLDHSPRSRMVKIVPDSDRFEQLMVTENHVLTVICPENTRIVSRVNHNGVMEWCVSQIILPSSSKPSILSSVDTVFPSESSALEFVAHLRAEQFLNPTRYDLTIAQYTKLSDDIKSRVQIFRPSPDQPQIYAEADLMFEKAVSQAYSTLTQHTFNDLSQVDQQTAYRQCAWLIGYQVVGGVLSELVDIFNSSSFDVVVAISSILSIDTLRTSISTSTPQIRRSALAGIIDACDRFDVESCTYSLITAEKSLCEWFHKLSVQLGYATSAVTSSESIHSCQVTGLEQHLRMLPIRSIEKQCVISKSLAQTYPYGSTFSISSLAPADACDPSSSLDDQPYVSFSVSGNERFLLSDGLVCHNSKKWDEWVEIDSKRIQPKFNVGDRLTLRDSVNKITEAIVMEVAIKENQLKIFVRFVGFSNKWDEWIPANSNRIISRYDKEKTATHAPHAALQKALGLSSPDALRLPPCPFDIAHRVGVVEKVDLRSGQLTDEEDGPLVLVRVTDESLNVTMLMWLKLALLRSAMPLAHQTPTHLCPVKPKPRGFNAATLHAMHLDMPQLVQFTIEAQQKSLAIMAKRIIQQAVNHIQTSVPPSTSDSSPNQDLLPLSPISPLAPMLHPTESLDSLTRLLQHIQLSDLIPLLCHPLCPSSVTSILNFAQSESIGHTFESKRTRIVATVAQLIIARWHMDRVGMVPSEESHSHLKEHVSFEDDVFQLIESCSQSLLHAATKQQLQPLTVIAPGQSITVGTDPRSGRPLGSAIIEPAADMDDAIPPFHLQLVSIVLDPSLLDVLPPKFSRESVWTIRFYADASNTILLKEVGCTGDPQTRLVPPFVVSNPVYITASHSTKSAKEAKVLGKNAKSVKFAGDAASVSFAITPFTHDSFEVMSIITESIVHIRRMQVAGRQSLNDSTASSSSASSIPSTSFASPTFLRNLIRSTSLSTTLDHFLTILFEGLKDFLDVFSHNVPGPSNLKVRTYDTISLILAVNILTQKARREQRKLVRTRKSAGQTNRAIERELKTNDLDHSLHAQEDQEHELTLHDDELDVSWLIDSVIPEARSRLAAERHQFPLHSVYLQHLFEFLLVAVRYEWMVTSNEAMDIGDMQRSTENVDGLLRASLQKDMPIVLTMETMILHASDPAAHPPLDDTHADASECKCAWCQDLADMREDSQQASAMMDLSPSSILGTLLYDLDVYPDECDLETGLRSRAPSSHASSAASPTTSNRLNIPTISSERLIVRRPSASTSSFSTLFHAINTATGLFRSDSHDSHTHSHISEEQQENALSSASSPSSSSSSALVPSDVDWRYSVSLCDRILSLPTLRTRMLHLLLNGTSSPNLPRPEIAFRRGADIEEMTSITQAKHLYRTLPHMHPMTSAAMKERKKKSLMSVDESLGRGNMFQQLVDAFLKASLHCKPISLRAEVGAVTFKCILSGILDQGAAGLPGPFRQALAEISSFLNAEALDSAAIESGTSLFIPTPNSRSQTGDDRNKLLLNPSLLQKGEISLVKCHVFGQLLGIAIRSKCCLNMDLSAVIWKQLLEIPLVPEDLQSFDYTASKSLKFIDPMNDLPFTQEEFDEYLDYLTWTTVLSDGTTQVELKPGGATQKVHFHQRHQYAAMAIDARLQESALLVSAIREGLLSVIPKQCFQLMSWRELELRVCGRPTIDLLTLERHTVYSPSSYNKQTPIIRWFWTILQEFTQEELGQFLQFCWARARLPADDQIGSYRMQLNIIDASPRNSVNQQENSSLNDMLLPTSETCFFNVNMPKYTNLETMRAKIKMALLCSTITS